MTEVLTAFDELCRENVLVPCELNLFLAEWQWALRTRVMRPIERITANARMGVRFASGQDLTKARRQWIDSGLVAAQRSVVTC